MSISNLLSRLWRGDVIQISTPVLTLYVCKGWARRYYTQNWKKVKKRTRAERSDTDIKTQKRSHRATVRSYLKEEEEEEKSKKAIWFSRSGEGYRRARQRGAIHKKEECAERTTRVCVAEKGKKNFFFFFLKLTAKFYDTQKDRGSRYCTWI